MLTCRCGVVGCILAARPMCACGKRHAMTTTYSGEKLCGDCHHQRRLNAMGHAEVERERGESAYESSRESALEDQRYR